MITRKHPPGPTAPAPGVAARRTVVRRRVHGDARFRRTRPRTPAATRAMRSGTGVTGTRRPPWPASTPSSPSRGPRVSDGDLRRRSWTTTPAAEPSTGCARARPPGPCPPTGRSRSSRPPTSARAPPVRRAVVVPASGARAPGRIAPHSTCEPCGDGCMTRNDSAPAPPDGRCAPGRFGSVTTLTMFPRPACRPNASCEAYGR